MSDLSKYIREQMKDPEFKELYEKSEGEYQVAREIIKARIEKNMTQQELAEKTGMRQSNISRIENGSCSPTVETLSIIAEGLGKKLEIRFV
ncbi:MAG: helix-turn-helix transcriptional regulator [Firmicutes bacterium]|nr:helix-turn-helix transcriptional regulator [Bacillota bacterium]